MLGFDSDLLEKPENCFIIYQGSHGEKGAEIADVILPSAAYTEKDAIYVNTEGRPQMAYRAVFSPGESQEDWKIIHDLAGKMKFDLGFNDLDSLRQILSNKNPIFSNIDNIKSSVWKHSINGQDHFSDEEIIASKDNFYLTNIISRASKTMVKCSNLLKK